ncbi:MAG: type II secretion system protein N [Gammaproteobacteria bacterium]|nr:type II secretion system protein N [Gammaproteobacteria bacterium]
MMVRYISAGVLLALLFSIIMAPASLLRRVTSDVPGLELIGMAGTVWSGSGGVVVQGEKVGQATWAFRPLGLLSLELTWDVQFTGRDAELNGGIGISPGAFRVNASGVLGEDALNYSLQQWDLHVAGAVSVESIDAVWKAQQLTSLEGRLSWPGGPISWFMDGQTATATLPAMTGQLAQSAGAVSGLIVPDEGQTPVAQIGLSADGMFTLKISKLMTILLGRPWPGSDPDHAIVIEMVDRVF